MVVKEIEVDFKGNRYPLQFDTDDGFEVLQYQLYSLTLVPPEKQKIMSGSSKVLQNELDISHLSLKGGHPLTLLEEEDIGEHSLQSGSNEDIQAIMASDEELARMLQAEEEALFVQQQYVSTNGQVDLESRLEPYVRQVMQYEDPVRQEAARSSVLRHELEEKAAIALAKNGQRNPTQFEMEDAFLFQLLLWFKQSFSWTNSPSCKNCRGETAATGGGHPTAEELQFGANRVEIYRCMRCSTITRFPRYNDPMKLLETRTGRCGEWANCFTLYCRAFGYRARLILDFTDHVWTECYSAVHERWVHLDPCESVMDRPLLYEEGWNKKLNYVFALAKDGVYDVTKRYTRKWHQVLLLRNLTSEDSVKAVVMRLTTKIRSSLSPASKQELQRFDILEEEELQSAHQQGIPEALPGRQTGTLEWRLARGELGNPSLPLPTAKSSCPVRLCIDSHVSNVLRAFGVLWKDSRNVSEYDLNAVLKIMSVVFDKLKASPYKSRNIIAKLDSEIFSLNSKIGVERFETVLSLLVLKQDISEVEVCIGLSGAPIDTALALLVAIEQLKNLQSLAEEEGTGVQLTRNKRLQILSSYDRICGRSAQASGEEPPSGIVTSAFDGLHSTKWEEPVGAKGSWIIYHLQDAISKKVAVYEITSANDCPERDPKDWILEGSCDGGETWHLLDERRSEQFARRFQNKMFEIPQEKQMECNVLRLKFISVWDMTKTDRLQIACIDFYTPTL